MSTWPDVEGALRTWLRAQSGVSAIVGNRVFFGVPRKATESSFPMVVVTRVGGAPDLSEAPVDLALVQVDCWGSLNGAGDPLKATATDLVNAVRAALESVNGRTTLTAGVDVFGIAVESVIWSPDPDNDRPRYSVTAEVAAIAS